MIEFVLNQVLMQKNRAKVYFVFGIHNHQPIGNLADVFNKAFDYSYQPFLELLKDFPQIKCVLHNSGPVYEWAKSNKHSYLGLLRQLIEAKQIEIISAAYYEPILTLIPEADRRAQISLMNKFLREEFLIEPQGFWLAERVWEPALIKTLNSQNIKYTFIDETHFLLLNEKKKELFGYYISEEEGYRLLIFPMNKRLMYKVPFVKPQEVINILEGMQQEEDVLVTLFQDGEKFGLWPDTFDWVYNKGWLAKFFSLLGESSIIETITASEAIERFKPEKLTYLKSASYKEMQEWSLDSEDNKLYQQLKDYLKIKYSQDDFKALIGAGNFKNFLLKYPRLNYMHKRMLDLSRQINQNLSTEEKEVFDNLWKAQTNCAYWHGIFGGFYLKHLRESVYAHLIKAENLLEQKTKPSLPVIEEKDIDYDGNKEIILKNKGLIACFSKRGGTFLELSLRKEAFNLINTVTRKKEAYHPDKDSSTALIYDNYQRLGLVDHLLAKNIRLDDFIKNKKVNTLSNDIYQSSYEKFKNAVRVKFMYNKNNLNFIKEVEFDEALGFRVSYDFKKINTLNNWDFGIEFNLSLNSLATASTNEKKGSFTLDTPRDWGKAKSFLISDQRKKLNFQCNFDPAQIFTQPLRIISSSESGLENLYQQMVIMFIVRGPVKKFDLAVKIKGGDS